ncbi:MAG: hypothetical protein KAX38_10110, partial [Candidatus Krumholzibacteria bacterium]|nr:hypothetical protein [Candidatus Krumholzibacteria bacterium]
YITQPAVSICLKNLQDELGSRLFEVRGRTVKFTGAGEVVLEYARRFSHLEKELLEEIKDLEGLEKGRIALGTIDAASIYVLPEIFSRFHGLYPGIDVFLEIASTAPLLRELKGGHLDLVVGTLPIENSGDFEVFPVYKEVLVLIAPTGHPLAGRRRLTPDMLSGYPFISFHEESITRHIVEEALLRKGITPRITMAIDSPESIKNLVASGLGLAVLPKRMVRTEIGKGAISVLKVRGLRFERRLGLVLSAGRYLSSTVRAFLGVLEKGLNVKLPERLRLEEKATERARPK